MANETITDKEGISIMTLFLIGSSLIFVEGIAAKNDIWLSVIISMLMALPILLIYCRLHYLFPGKDLFDIIDMCLPKIITKIIIFLYALHFIEACSETLLDYGYFIKTIGFDLTPIMVPIALYLILCVASAKLGIKVLTNWSKPTLYIVIASITMLLLFSIPNMKLNNLRPILYNGISPVLQGSFEILSFPFAYTIVFLATFSSFKKRTSPYKIYLLSLLIGGTIVTLTYTSNIMILGSDLASILYYPTYTAFSHINVGFIQRIEIFISIIFSLGGFIELSTYLIAGTKGICKLFNSSNYKILVIPIALIIINLCNFHYESIMQYFELGVTSWPYYSFVFQTILPIFILVVAEIRKKQIAPVYKKT